MLTISKNQWQGYYSGHFKNGNYQISHSLLQACTALDLLEAWIPQESPNFIQDNTDPQLIFFFI